MFDGDVGSFASFRVMFPRVVDPGEAEQKWPYSMAWASHTWCMHCTPGSSTATTPTATTAAHRRRHNIIMRTSAAASLMSTAAAGPVFIVL